MSKLKENESKGEIILFESGPDISIEVKLEDDTVWLSQKLMSKLFDKDSDTIGLHINNIYKEGELEEKATTEESSAVQKEGNRTVKRKIKYYNLDVIISVGYRVKSKQGTQFRIWANKILKEYLIKGYALNEKVLKEKNERIKELETTLTIFSKVIDQDQIGKDEFAGILRIVSDYTYALDTLDGYDLQKLQISETTKEETFQINYEKSIRIIEKMKEKFGGSTLFGKEKDDSFKGTLGAIYQTYGKKELYPSLEEKAAHLIYFTIKNHSFIDGNKRIAAAIFLWYLEMNNNLYNEKGHKRIADNALVGLCLLIAQSDPAEKETVVKVIVNLINKKNT